MSTSKTPWRGHEEKNLKGKLAQRLSSFHSGIPMTMAPQAELCRPKTLLDLLVGVFLAKTTFLENKKQLTKEQQKFVFIFFYFLDSQTTLLLISITHANVINGSISDISLTLRAYPVDFKS